MMQTISDLPILEFKTVQSWQDWLAKNHTQQSGIWIKFFKKNSGVPTITYAQALDEALCYGWIDSQAKKIDESSYKQKFTPRRPRSIWSGLNTKHIERLIKEGRMKPSGLKEVAEAKKDGRWHNAYDSASEMKIPDDFLKELAKDKKAETFFKTLNKTNLYAIGWRLQTAKKSETRLRRMKVILDKLKKGKNMYE